MRFPTLLHMSSVSLNFCQKQKFGELSSDNWWKLCSIAKLLLCQWNFISRIEGSSFNFVVLVTRLGCEQWQLWMANFRPKLRLAPFMQSIVKLSLIQQKMTLSWGKTPECDDWRPRTLTFWIATQTYRYLSEKTWFPIETPVCVNSRKNFCLQEENVNIKFWIIKYLPQLASLDFAQYRIVYQKQSVNAPLLLYYAPVAYDNYRILRSDHLKKKARWKHDIRLACRKNKVFKIELMKTDNENDKETWKYFQARP